jgi:hypothetical protein
MMLIFPFDVDVYKGQGLIRIRGTPPGRNSPQAHRRNIKRDPEQDLQLPGSLKSETKRLLSTDAQLRRSKIAAPI